eukprot:6577579-Karenia_brevis.AAC.1
MHHMSIIFAGFQEMRNSADSKALHGYHRFVTDSVYGREECESGCNIEQPYARFGGRHYYFNIKRIRI